MSDIDVPLTVDHQMVSAASISLDTSAPPSTGDLYLSNPVVNPGRLGVAWLRRGHGGSEFGAAT
jgi:hypothetical protein